ncbi:predicted protein [Aspergillus terreus NIH2624]|uniref:Cytochrome P450 n=1 Tax=Aspergillus terreus (strain NIH 2624 / FGSC A1156) TaxID=341663 RepID=Q0CUG4_ASPTN|nr:uncharacterized protein ATEG_02670 [Aspergillus terreus NIH2624]EAU37632.1 predicted protein [Aspergillus terreus NIH2624]
MPDIESAKTRRSLLQPHLSDRSVKQIQPVLEQSINQFSRILQNASGYKPGVDLSLGYRSVTIDMLLRYGFGKSLKSLDAGSFNCEMAEDMDDVLFGSLIAKHFPNMGKAVFELLLQLPLAIAKMVKVSSILEMRKAVVLLFAGGEATAISVIIGTFHLLSDPERLHTLKQELLSAMPDGQSLALSELERLPYLTIVSSSHYVYHFDPQIFDDPFAFKPERWLDENNAQHLDKYMLSFSRGSRGCIGIK